MKTYIRMTLILLAVMLLAGCSLLDMPEETRFGWSLYDRYRAEGIPMEEFTQNTDHEYVRCTYEGYMPEEDEKGEWIYPPFLTSESETMLHNDQFFQRIESTEQLNRVKVSIENNRSDLESKREFFELSVKYDGIPYEIDEAFFREHHLYVVEFCFEGNPWLRSRLDMVSVKDHAVTIAISYETTHAWTGNFPAEVYFIVIPADAESVDVTLTETAWLDE